MLHVCRLCVFCIYYKLSMDGCKNLKKKVVLEKWPSCARDSGKHSSTDRKQLGTLELDTLNKNRHTHTHTTYNNNNIHKMLNKLLILNEQTAHVPAMLRIFGNFSKRRFIVLQWCRLLQKELMCSAMQFGCQGLADCSLLNQRVLRLNTSCVSVRQLISSNHPFHCITVLFSVVSFLWDQTHCLLSYFNHFCSFWGFEDTVFFPGDVLEVKPLQMVPT